MSRITPRYLIGLPTVQPIPCGRNKFNIRYTTIEGTSICSSYVYMYALPQKFKPLQLKLSVCGNSRIIGSYSAALEPVSVTGVQRLLIETFNSKLLYDALIQQWPADFPTLELVDVSVTGLAALARWL